MTTPAGTIPDCPFKARVICSYEPAGPKDIPLTVDSYIIVSRTHSSGWWKGVSNGQRGWFPSNHVQPLGIVSQIDFSPVQSTVQSPSQQIQLTPAPAPAPKPKEKHKFQWKPKKKSAKGSKNQTGRIFGRSFREVTQLEAATVPEAAGRGMPLFIDHALNFIYQHGLSVTGLFRVCASQAQIDEYVIKIDNDSTATMRDFPLDGKSNEASVTLLGALVKLFLRSQPELMWPEPLFRPMMDTCAIENKVTRRKAVAQLLKDPLVEPSVYRFICRFAALLKATKRDGGTLMDSTAFATIFGAVIFRSQTDLSGQFQFDPNLFGKQICAFKWLVDDWYDLAPLLDCSNDGRPGRPAGSVRPPDPVQSQDESEPDLAQIQPEPEPQQESAPQLPPPPAKPAPSQRRAKVVFDFTGEDESYLNVSSGAIVVVENIDQGWCLGYCVDNPSLYGWFPETYIEML